jgi:hypothetical protein
MVVHALVTARSSTVMKNFGARFLYENGSAVFMNRMHVS